MAITITEDHNPKVSPITGAASDSSRCADTDTGEQTKN